MYESNWTVAQATCYLQQFVDRDVLHQTDFDDTLYKVHDTFPVMIDPDELNLMTNLNSNLDFVLADSIIILQSSYPGFLHFPNKFPYMQAANNLPSNNVKYKVQYPVGQLYPKAFPRAITTFLFSSKIDLQIPRTFLTNISSCYGNTRRTSSQLQSLSHLPNDRYRCGACKDFKLIGELVNKIPIFWVDRSGGTECSLMANWASSLRAST